MRWTSRVKLLFLAPAVVWVLVFTVFPLVYSLYISVYNVETKMQVKQEKVPVVGADGKQMMSTNGSPKPASGDATERRPISTTASAAMFASFTIRTSPRRSGDLHLRHHRRARRNHPQARPGGAVPAQPACAGCGAPS
jgi:ABC-type sugar transport system permease subunit